MGLGIKWFKGYEIQNDGETCQAFGFICYDHYSINFIDMDSTSHSYGNASLIKKLFEEIIGESFPSLPNEEHIDSEDFKLDIIEPDIMSKYCEKILAGTEVDKIDARKKFEWFKRISDKGYYIAYDWQ